MENLLVDSRCSVDVLRIVICIKVCVKKVTTKKSEAVVRSVL